ncbi:MAG: adenosine-specific kinase [Candidatus Micrarchaeaceae archaeon]
MDMEIIKVKKEDQMQVVIGHAGFIKSIEDLYEALMSSVPNVKFGIAFAEASGKRLVRSEGNDSKLKKLAEDNMLSIGAGHSFIILMEGAYPINTMMRIKAVDEVARIFCATANPVEVIVAKTAQGRGIIGVVDGAATLGLESEADRKERIELLRNIGYKLGL